jgi:DNA polymerase, archaea type
LLVRTHLQPGAAVPRAPAAAADLGPHSGGATYLFAAGVAQQVVKADIASMYPSIMRVYGIGPAADRLGVLLALVGRLTDLRLAHKQAARAATPGSAAAQQHDAVQAAMKILVNSAYGYMGAGAMALLADRAAADAVTRQGRAILDGLVTALRARGMALLEADTDGVFFAAPAGWSAAQERSLVAEVAATLPAGLRLEYEGRYRAMLSHEVKNYALLTYDGRLILRGGALRSRRAEPFGTRFLQEAIRCTLLGDVAGAQAAYGATVTALRARRLSAADVATQARLARTPEEYRGARERQREAPYEALLNAGRTSWAVGEQVRYYRARDGRFVWLPDRSDAPPEESDDARAWTPDTGAAAGAVEDAAAGPADYDVAHYLRLLHGSYVARLRKAFDPAGFAQLFRPDGQLGLFDQPLGGIEPRWIRAGTPAAPPPGDNTAPL